MSSLNLYPLPYTKPQPPPELFRTVETASGCSDTTAFDAGLDERDRDIISGRRICVVCGEYNLALLEHCHIIPKKDKNVWNLLKKLGWAPVGVKNSPIHESRNGITLCSNHHLAFDDWQFFIRFQHDTRKYVFVLYDSYNHVESMQPYHGKVIALDSSHSRAPLPLLFLVHEYMVRGRNFYQSTSNIQVTDAPTFDPSAYLQPATKTSARLQTSTVTAGPSDSQTIIMPPTASLVEELLAYQHTMPSWKAWQKETMGWEGTTEENLKKYVENIGVDPESAE